ncbi:cardiolipin synthase [Treponema sp.]
MSALQSGLLGALLSLMHVLAALAVSVHAALYKRNTRSAIGWIGLAWLAPFVGAPLYLLLGINRIQRAAASLGLTHEWEQEDMPEALLPNAEGLAAIGHSGFVGMDRLVRTLTGRPLCSGNRIQPLVNGDEAYPAMLEAINGAKKSVALVSYIFDNDTAGISFVEALFAAKKRGVEVRVLVDALGARYSRKSIIEELRALNVPAAYFLRTRVPRLFRYANLRNHRKLLVVDGCLGFTGGINIRSGHIIENKPAYPILCLHFKVEGPIIADLMRTFAIDWAFSTKEKLSGDSWLVDYSQKGSVFARGIPDGPDTHSDNMQKVMIGALTAAQFSARIVTPYFLPEGALTAALMSASLRGVQVDIVIPKKSNIFVMDWAMRPQLRALIKNGCNIYLSPPPFDHAKFFVVDKLWSLIGSTNWDPRSLRLNFEYNLECYDGELASHLDTMAAERIQYSEQLSLATLSSQAFLFRLRDGFTRLFTPYL